MLKLAVIPAVVLLLSPITWATEFESIKIKKGIEIINQTSFGAESVAVSDDGSKLCWIAKSRDSKIVIPGDIFMRDLNDDAVKRAKKGGALNAFTKCSFDEKNNLVTSKLHWRPLALTRTIVTGLISGDMDPKGFVSSISIFDEDSKKVRDIRPKSLGLKSNRIFLKHPRVSPNGEWITYYLKHGKKIQGVYLHHFASGKTHQLSNVYDKHPTWSPDGSKILFHYQIDATETQPEMAYLGYFDVNLSESGDLIESKRIMLDEPKDVGFRYQKHPAILAGTNLVFFHGEENAGDKKDIFVRDLSPNSKVFKIKMEIEDVKITKAKHPASGAFDDSIYFIGKTKGAEEDMVLRLTPKALAKITAELK